MAAAVALPAAPAARADRSVRRALDVDLLDTDCAVVARVGRIEALGSTTERQAPHAVTLDVEQLLWCRWDFAERKPATFTAPRSVLGEEDGARALHVPHRGTLREGGRYLLLMRGGAFRYGPFLPEGILAVDDEGRVPCGGGHLYGIHPMGLSCSWSGAEVGEPATVDELGGLLRAARANAALRRPDVAAHCDGLGRTLVGGGGDAH